jgi:hypothetical protein
MNYLIHTNHARQFIKEHEDFIFDVFMEGYSKGEKGHVAIDLDDENEIWNIGFDEFDRRQRKYIRLNCYPILKSSEKKIIPLYIQIKHDGELWWSLKKFINLNEYVKGNFN